MSIPRRHHYLPQYYIKGFQGSDGFYHVYDKTADKIRRYTSSKSIFFEWNRFTITEDGYDMPLVEEAGYSVFDANQAPIITALQTEHVNHDSLSDENTKMLISFIIGLYWRVPNSDNHFNSISTGERFTIYEEDKLIFDSGRFHKRYRSVNTIKQVQRALMMAQTLTTYNQHHATWEFNSAIYEINENWFALGDYPNIYLTQPVEITEVITQTLYLPLSAKRIYSTLPEQVLEFDAKDVLTLNAIAIHQAKQYICCADKQALEESVRLYKTLKQEDRLDSARKYLFGRT